MGNIDKSTLQFDIVISGATPEGLFLAYQLQRMGHSICIYDSRPAPDREKQDLIELSPHTMTLFHALGIAHHFSNVGVAMQDYRYIHLDEKAGTVCSSFSNDVAAADPLAPFPLDIVITRSQAESILGDLVTGSQGTPTLFWNTYMTEYEDSPAANQNKILLTTVANEGEPSIIQIQTRYLVITDTPEKNPTMAVLSKIYPDWCIESRYEESYYAPLVSVHATCKLDGQDKDILDQQRKTNISFLANPASCTFTPLPSIGDNYFRINYVAIASTVAETTSVGHSNQDRAPKTGQAAHPVVSSIKDMQDLVSQTCGELDLVVSDTQDIRQTVNAKCTVFIANGFRRGKAFLLGDAAHDRHNWIGFHEANNLAWKLSFVLGNVADSDMLLDSYSYECERLAYTFLRPKHMAKAKMAKLIWDALSDLLRIAVWNLLGYHDKANNIRNKKYTRRAVVIDAGSPLLLRNAVESRTSLISPGEMIPETLPLWRRGDRTGMARSSLSEILLGTSSSAKYIALWVCTRQTSCKRPDRLTHAFWTRTTAPNRRSSLRPVVVGSVSQVPQRHALPAFVVTENPDNDASGPLIAGAFWMELWETEYSVTRRIGLMPILEEHKDDADPPVALVMIRPDGYVAGSFLIQAPDDIDRALELFSLRLLA